MIYLWSDTALLLLKDRATAVHSHYALEIYLGIDGPFQMDLGEGDSHYRCLLLNSKVPPQIYRGKGNLRPGSGQSGGSSVRRNAPHPFKPVNGSEM